VFSLEKMDLGKFEANHLYSRGAQQTIVPPFLDGVVGICKESKDWVFGEEDFDCIEVDKVIHVGKQEKAIYE